MDELKVFTGNAHPALAQEVCEYLKMEVGKCEVMQFANENTFVRINENVRQRDVFVIQPISSPVNNNLVETRRDGKSIYYSLARTEVREVIEALHRAFCAPGRPR